MPNNRIRQIMTLLMEEKRVIAKELAARFGVSDESIRRDLSELERQGVVRKIYGGAVLVEEHAPAEEAALWQVRKTEHLAQKQAIARVAAAQIGENATVYLDSGSTLYQLLPLLRQRSGLTVITRSLRNAAVLGMCENLTVYCIGGAVKVDTLVNTGFMAQECLACFSHIDLAILSGDGIIPAQGLVDFGMENMGFKHALVERSDRVMALVDHSKFGRSAHCITCPTPRIHTLVTDSAAPSAAVKDLRQRGVQVLTAE